MNEPSAIWRTSNLRGKRVAVLVFSPYAKDPRPRRAAEALLNLGMTVDVICVREDPTDPKKETLNGVEILRLPIKRRRGSKSEYLLRYAAFILMGFAILTRRSLTQRYDLVHVHNMPDLLVLSSLLAKALGAKVILDLHDPMPELMMTIFGLDKDARSVRLLKRLEKLSIGLADVVLTVNLACKRLFAARSCPQEKIDVVMNSPDDELIPFQPVRSDASTMHAPRKPFVLMYHGSCV